MNIKSFLWILLVVAICLTAYAWLTYVEETDLGDKVVSIVIKQGDSFNAVAEELAAKEVVGSSFMLKAAARFNKIDRKLTPGRYDFNGKNSCQSVLAKLAAADFLKIKVTIPEGSTLRQVASILQQQMQLDSTAIVQMNTDHEFLGEVDLPCLEGYLFPETYFFPWGSSLESVLMTLISQHRAMTDTIWGEGIADGLSRNDIIVLASIIEAETGRGDEREIVSSVYHNRLRRNMKLDADPTVIYGLGGLDRPLWKRDLKKQTPYNTYQNKGLPPSAINSPGLAAILAALHPSKTDYLYFVADDSGKHHFSKSNAEHNRFRDNIRAQRRKGK